MFNVSPDGFDGFPVFFSHGKFKEFCCIIDARGQTFETADDAVEEFLFLADFLSMFRIVPEIRIFNLTIDFFESARFAIDVKDTPEVRPDGLSGLR